MDLPPAIIPKTLMKGVLGYMPDISGIYAIKNTANRKMYVWQNATICKRFPQHKAKLNKGSHVNCPLQTALDKYRADCFEFIVLENCKKGQMNQREFYWIDKTSSARSGYNQPLGSGGLSWAYYKDMAGDVDV